MEIGINRAARRDKTPIPHPSKVGIAVEEKDWVEGGQSGYL